MTITNKVEITITEFNEKEFLQLLRLTGRIQQVKCWESSYFDKDGRRYPTHNIKVITEEKIK